MSEPVPQEIQEAVKRVFGATLVTSSRVVWGKRGKVSKNRTWIAAQRSGKANNFFDETGRERHGWRKCHTENYWAYWAKYPTSVIDVLASVIQG